MYITTQDGSSLDTYIEKAFVKELKLAGVYDEKAKITISGYIKEYISSSSLSDAHWTINIDIKSSNGKQFNIAHTTKYDASFSGFTACMEDMPNADGWVSPVGDLFGNAMQGKEVNASTEQEQQAEIMLRAMINAAKSDGNISEDEQRKITEHLGDVSTEELELVRQIMKEPQDLPRLISSVPAGMEQQVYLMSLLAINLDSKPEAQYLDQFAKGLNINEQQCNEIHAKLGVPNLYG
jgi:hypothetical protein